MLEKEYLIDEKEVSRLLFYANGIFILKAIF